jgi:pimeloyl-ACP methyl ester carboxylesterase
MNTPMQSLRTIERPSWALFGVEPWRAAFEYASHHISSVEAVPAKGDGHPVIIFPGMGTNGMAVAPLRRFCRSLGYEALDWGRGFNRGPQGDMDAWLAELEVHTTELLSGFAQSATFIGWSLGGIYARELSKTMGHRVRQVITIGTPFNANADHTNVGWIFRLLSGSAPQFTEAMSARLRSAPAVPTTSIYSRSDGVVAWETCLHAGESPHVQDLEVRGSHVGLGWNRAVLRIVGDRLSQAPDQWLPYAADSSGAHRAEVRMQPGQQI